MASLSLVPVSAVAQTHCVGREGPLVFGFYAYFAPVSHSADADPDSPGFNNHLGYEADLVTALERMDEALSFSRQPLQYWNEQPPPIWLRSAGPELDVVGGGITILESRTRDASGRTAVAFTNGHIAFRQSLLVRAADAARLAAYSDLTDSVRVGVLAGTTGEARLLQLAGLTDAAGVLREGVRIVLRDGRVLVADGTANFYITAAETSSNVEGRVRLEPATEQMPQVIYLGGEEGEQELLDALRAGRIDAVARGEIGNRDAAHMYGDLVVTALDSQVELGGFTVDAGDTALLACLNRRIDWLTDNRRIGYGDWRNDPSVFLQRARLWDGTAPLLEKVTIASNNADTGVAVPGDVVTLTLTGSEALAPPVVTIAGAQAQVSGDGREFAASHVVTADDPEGPVLFDIRFQDLAGNEGDAVAGTTDGSSVRIKTGLARRTATKAWLARFGRMVASETVALIGARDTAAPGSYLKVAGLNPQEQAMNGDPLAYRILSLARGAAGQGVRLPLRQLLADGTAFQLVPGKSSPWALWGHLGLSRTEGRERGLAIDGELLSGHLGVDYRVHDRLLAGIAVSRASGDADVQDPDLGAEIETRLHSVYPYARWSATEKLSFWGSAGFGWGDNAFADARGEVETDIRMNMLAAGMRGHLFTGAGADIALKADAFGVEISTSDSEELGGISADAERLRVALEGSYRGESGLAGRLEVGGRLDGGDAETGTGLDLGGELSYSTARFDLAARIRWLAAHREQDFEEWSAGLSIALRPRAAGQGLSLSLTPSWGNGLEARSLVPFGAGPQVRLPGESVAWAGAGQRMAATGLAPNRLDFRFGYGFAVGNALVSPYGELQLAGGRPQALRAGARLNLRQGLRLALYGQRRQWLDAPAEHGAALEVVLDMHSPAAWRRP